MEIAQKSVFDKEKNQFHNKKWVQNKLNNRQRKKIEFLSPNEFFY